MRPQHLYVGFNKTSETEDNHCSPKKNTELDRLMICLGIKPFLYVYVCQKKQICGRITQSSDFKIKIAKNNIQCFKLLLSYHSAAGVPKVKIATTQGVLAHSQGHYRMTSVALHLCFSRHFHLP